MMSFKSLRAALLESSCAIAVLISANACSSDMGDSAGQRMNLGLSEARSGLSQTQSGVGKVKSDARSSGMTDIGSGMDMMNQGVADMHSGMNMMSSGMMSNCMDGGSGSMMNSLQDAMNEMHTGQSMLMGDASSDDTDALAHMDSGLTMMGAALDQAQSSMNCMGHSNMMSGSGMM